MYVCMCKAVFLHPSSFSLSIARQDKAQQLAVVRESLKVFKATPPTPMVASPIVSRRKAAALNVLQGLCHDVAGGDKSWLSAA